MFNLPKRVTEVDNSTSKTTLNLSGKTVSDPIYEAYMSLNELETQSMELVYEHVYATYTGLRSDNMEIVKEGLGDFLSGAVNFFKELIKRLIEFFKSVGVYLYSMFANFDKFIEKYKDKLMEGKKQYSVMGYEYTFTADVPKVNVMTEIVGEFNKEITEVTKMKKADIVTRRDEYLSEDNMDMIRGKIIGVGKPIASEDFRSTLFEMFRSGQDTEKEIRITSAELRSYMNGYKDLRKKYDEAKKERIKLEKVYLEIQRFFEKGARVQYVGQDKKARATTLNVDMSTKSTSEGDFINYDDSRVNLELINAFYQFKWRQAQEIGTYSFQAFVERLNALKEATKFYETVIRKAIFASPKGEEL